MDGQPPYKSSEKILELIQKETNIRLEYHIEQLESLLYKIGKKVQKKAYTYELDRSRTLIGLDCNKPSNEPMWCGYNIEINLYNQNKAIECRLDKKYVPSKIICTNYSNKSFELSNSPQNIYFIEGIKNSILNIINISYPEVLANMSGKYNIYTKAVVSMDYNNPRKENPEISKDSNLLRYNSSKSNIVITLYLYDTF
jgi:hypothetical protein